jgi:hypothetical protein
MPNERDSFLIQIRSPIERRINEQIERHRRITPDVDIRNVIDIQIRQEIEKLNLLLENEEDPTMAKAFQILIEWLPQFARQLKG